MAHPGGRPTDYDEEFHCKDIVRIQGEGRSIYEVAKEWGQCTSTIYNWKNTHKKFLEAFIRAQEAHRAWWDEFTMKNIVQDSNKDTAFKVNDTMYRLTMANRFKVSDRSADGVVELPTAFYETDDVKIKQNILDTQLALKSITTAQYDTLSRTLQLQFDREEGRKVLQVMNEAENEKNKNRHGR